MYSEPSFYSLIFLNFLNILMFFLYKVIYLALVLVKIGWQHNFLVLLNIFQNWEFLAKNAKKVVMIFHREYNLILAIQTC